MIEEDEGVFVWKVSYVELVLIVRNAFVVVDRVATGIWEVNPKIVPDEARFIGSIL